MKVGKDYKVLVTFDTGEVIIRRFSHNHFKDEQELIESVRYQWNEGNHSCDCNRWLAKQRAKGNDPDLDDARCGDSIDLISIVIEEISTGRTIDVPITHRENKP